MANKYDSFIELTPGYESVVDIKYDKENADFWSRYIVNDDMVMAVSCHGFSLPVYLSNNYGVYSPTKTKDAVLAVAAEKAYHPIKEYLEALPEWDNIKRVETLYIDYFGAADKRKQIRLEGYDYSSCVHILLPFALRTEMRC